MARAYLNGIRIEMDQNATIADYEGLVGQAAAEMIQFRETWGDDDFIAISRTGDAYTLQRINGQDVIIMGPVPHAPDKLRPLPSENEDLAARPAVCFDLWGAPNAMSGFYVCPGLEWEPIKFYPIDPDRPHATNNYRDLNADGQINQAPRDIVFSTEGDKGSSYVEEEFGTLPLEKIDSWGGAWTSTTTSDRDWHWGYFEPGRYPGGQNWPIVYPGISFAGPCAQTLGNCFEEKEYPDEPWHGYTGEYVHLFPTKYSRGVFHVINSYCSPIRRCCDGSTPTRHWGATQTQLYMDWWIGNSTVYFLGNHFGDTFWHNKTTIDSSMSGYGCSSQSVMQDEHSAFHVLPEEEAYVRGVDGYKDDETWIVFWSEYETPAQDVTYTKSPWVLPPYHFDEEHCEWPTPVRTSTQTYWMWVHTPDWEIKMQYAEPSQWTYPPGLGSTDDLFHWDTGIYDFYGMPVFVFSYTDARIKSFIYGSVFNGAVHFSDPFPHDDNYYHDVPQTDPNVIGRGCGMCSVVAHTVERKEEHVDTEQT